MAASSDDISTQKTQLKSVCLKSQPWCWAEGFRWKRLISS